MSCGETIDGSIENDMRILQTLLGKIDFLGGKRIDRDLGEHVRCSLVP